jgi:Bacterial PH domain
MASVHSKAIGGRKLALRSRLRARGLIDSLNDLLEQGENVLHLTHSTRGSARGLVAATDRRILVLGDGAEVKDIPYAQVRSFNTGSERAKPFIEIVTELGSIFLKGLGRDYEELVRIVHTRMWDASLPTTGGDEPAAEVRSIGRADAA